MKDRLKLYCPGQKGVSNAYRTGWSRIWGDQEWYGDEILELPASKPDSQKLEHYSKNPEQGYG